jgi:hypothetical protein
MWSAPSNQIAKRKEAARTLTVDERSSDLSFLRSGRATRRLAASPAREIVAYVHRLARPEGTAPFLLKSAAHGGTDDDNAFHRMPLHLRTSQLVAGLVQCANL